MGRNGYELLYFSENSFSSVRRWCSNKIVYGVVACSVTLDGCFLSGMRLLIIRGVVKDQRIVKGGMKAFSYQQNPPRTSPLFLLCNLLVECSGRELVGN